MANNSQWLKIQNNIFSLHPLTIIPIFFLVIIIYKFILITPKSKKHLPPCPRKLPIIGNFHQIDKRLPHRSLHNLAKKHGKIMLLQFGIKKVLIISSSEGAYEIMKTHDLIFANRPDLIMFKKLIYDCKDVATSPYGDYWRRMRSICVNQLLNNSRVQAFHIVREEEISHMNKQIKNRKLVNLSNLLSNFATDVICRAAFGMKFNGEIDGINFKDLHEKHEELVGSFNVGDFIPWLGWINYVNGVEKEVKRVKRDMNRILEGLIEEHLDGFRTTEGVIKGDNDSNYENTRDFVHVLLDLQKDNSDYAAQNCLTRESIKAIIMDMFVAGSTTTFASLEWAMSELLRNPRAMQTLQKEVRSITGDKEIITETDLNKMEYLKAVIKETFRLHPAVPLLLPRVSTKETTINGYDIPAGTQVIINAWSIHRDPSIWNEPNEFNPERFINSGIDFKGQHFNLIPFGAGRRGCPGILFGTANIELVIANLMQKFDWALPDNADGKSLDMVEYPGLTTHRDTPLILIATPYST